MSYLRNPTPRFPSYKGPYHIGTTLYEFSTAELDSPTPRPNDSINTVKFRLFYPTEDIPTASNSLRWLPEPHREYLSAYARFLGAGAFISEVFSYLPTLISRITIPVVQNASLKPSPRTSGKWPLLIFSHGLGGTCNSYSYLLASLASHGVVVVASDHRDGSSPLACINDPEKGPSKGLKRTEYKRVPHKLEPDVEKQRNDQLRIRLWELGLIHEAALRLDSGIAPVNLMSLPAKNAESSPSLKSSLDMHEPGSISWAGHSFGAATMVQFVKSVFWDPSSESNSTPSLSKFEPLFSFSPKTKLASQITPTSPLILLDLWTLPLRGESNRWLWERSLPFYDRASSTTASVLAILSEEFFHWEKNFVSTKRVLSATPTEEEPSSSGNPNGPRVFYPLRSAHLSQSDFGVLFPWVTKKWMGADEPERTLLLNVRAILQLLRENGIAVEDSREIDAEEEKEIENANAASVKVEKFKSAKADAKDWSIIAKDGKVQGWVSVSLDEMSVNEEKESL